MSNGVNYQIERKIEANFWVVKARWFYMCGIFLIGILTKNLSHSNVNFSYLYMVALLGSFFILNLMLYLGVRRIKKNYSKNLLVVISYTQVILELIYFPIIMHNAGGIESISMIFFFLPVISASLIFGAGGSIITAVVSGIIVNALVALEYYGYIPHVNRYTVGTLEFKDLSIGLTKTITTSIFYVIAGFFSGYGSSMLFAREKALEEKAKLLDLQTKKLVKRDLKLSQMNQELVEERNKISSIISDFTDPIIVLDEVNKIDIINPAARKMLGLTDKDLGKVINDKNNFSLENFRKIIKNEFQVTSIKDEKIANAFLEEVSLKYDNQEITYKIITAPVKGADSQYYGTMKIFYDLTREKMLDRLKTEFISIAAHQLRTPLSAIKWVIKMILDEDMGKLNSEQRELLGKGYKSNERVIGLVNDLLNVSRIEEGRFGYNFAKTDFQEILNIVIENIEREVARNHVNLAIKKDAKLPKISLDKDRLTLALQNILDNAVKYTPEYGKIEIEVVADDKNLKVAIKDNGVGIPAKEQGKLFSKFFRAENVTRLQTEGTGLGLFITKNIIESHGGRIYIASQEGKGTTVSFTIPIKKV